MDGNSIKRFLAAVMLIISTVGVVHAGVVSKEIRAGWKFRQWRSANWYPATVPGVVHTDLMANGLIEDPFFRLNERGLQWIDKEDWIYETVFDLETGMIGKSNIRLWFKGLDTYVDVFLNDEKILSADNMFRQWCADIGGIVKPEGNTLRVHFHSPIREDIPKWLAIPWKYEAGNDQSENGGVFDRKVSVFCRKAGYHYGWDWGPRLVTSGIWRPVVLQAWDDAKIENVQVLTENVSEKSAMVTVIAEVLSDREMAGAEVTVTDAGTGQTLGTVKTGLTAGLNKIPVRFTMKNPRLWWCNGLGDPHLYTFRTEITAGGQLLDSRDERTGIRSVELVREQDVNGQSFYFVLNGVPVFAKGANYIPCDNFLPRVTRATYRKTIDDAVAVNMNMLRVWGGGTYEDDYFYDLCDEAGIMVWQDFMFACSLYPAEGALLENIRQEAIDNVRRLRNHPSMVLWCGNNENQVAWFSWGWKEGYERQNPQWAETIWKQYKDQYFVTLPGVVAEHGSGIAYTPSSPFAGEEKAQNDHEGDRHFWGVWHQKRPIADYNLERSRFFSEYGIQSFPAFEAVKRYAPEPGDWSIASDVMMSHQRGGAHANHLIESYLLNEYRQPGDFEEFLYMNQLMQADAVKTAVEAHRRDKPYCMGTLFWQHNDCWPVASWSSRDWYGQWKALHYFMKPAFADVLVSPIEKEEIVEIHIVNDRLKEVAGTLTVKAIRLTGGEVFSKTMKTRVPANAARAVYTVGLPDLLGDRERGDVVIWAEFAAGNETYSNHYFLCKQKEVGYPPVALTTEIVPVEGGFGVTVSADAFARGVYLTIEGAGHHFSDNYFDILPGGRRTITVNTDLSTEEFTRQLKIRSLGQGI